AVTVNRDEDTFNFSVNSKGVVGEFVVDLPRGLRQVGDEVVLPEVIVSFSGLEVSSGSSSVSLTGGVTLNNVAINQTTMEIDIDSVADLQLNASATSGGVTVAGSVSGSTGMISVYDDGTTISLGDPNISVSASHDG